MSSGGDHLLALQNLPARADDHFFHGYINTGHFHAFFDNHWKAATTGYFHDDRGDALDAGLFTDLGEFFGTPPVHSLPEPANQRLLKTGPSVESA